MHLGYARVSTGDQNPDLQLTALRQAGCTRLFTDTATGAHVRRPELTQCLKNLGEGDTLTVWKLDRLGRSLRDLITHARQLLAQGEPHDRVAQSLKVSRRTLYRALQGESAG